MAYEISRRNEADYRWFRFEAPTSLLESLDHNLKIADGVLRFRIFKVDPEAPVLVPPAVAAPGPATGGSRSRDRAPQGSRGRRLRRQRLGRIAPRFAAIPAAAGASRADRALRLGRQ